MIDFVDEITSLRPENYSVGSPIVKKVEKTTLPSSESNQESL